MIQANRKYCKLKLNYNKSQISTINLIIYYKFDKSKLISTLKKKKSPLKRPIIKKGQSGFS